MARSYTVVMWSAILMCAAVVVSILAGATALPFVVAQCALPVVLGVGAVGAAMSIAAHRPAAMVAAVATVVGCGVVVGPAVTADPLPTWAYEAESFTVWSSNLYWTNDHVDDAFAAARRSDADAIVFAEFTPEFEPALRRSGLLDAYPTLVRDERRGTNVLLVRDPVVSTRIAGRGWNSLPVATVRAGRGEVTVIGVHTRGPHDLADLGGWSRDVAAVGDAAGDARTVIAIGDFNSTLWNPPLRRLLDVGFVDAHAATGAGLARTWGPLVWPIRGVPVLGIDHALSRGDVAPVDVDEVPVLGSDHRAIVVRYALR